MSDVQEEQSPSTTRINNVEAYARNGPGLPTLSIKSTQQAIPSRSPRLTPTVAGLQIQTHVDDQVTPTVVDPTSTAYHLQSWTSPHVTTSSISSNLSTSSMNSLFSPSSVLASPYLAAMSDLTPLPSPQIGITSDPFAWLRPGSAASNRSRGSSLDNTTPRRHPSNSTSPRKKKNYGSLMQEAAFANASARHETAEGSGSTNGQDGHSRHRSISEFTPETLQNVRHRVATVGSGEVSSLESPEYQLHREAYLAKQRGLTTQSTDIVLPTPPPSNSSTTENDDMEVEQPHLEDGSAAEYMTVHCGIHKRRRRFRELRQLGQGTFSKVMLATRERLPANPTPEIEEMLDPNKLVAIKIVEHGPAGGADGGRIETSLQREVEMLKSLSHPSLIHLKACESLETRTLLVLTYCPGGDLFDLASQKRELLTPPLVQRMFSELVGAVRYLHSQWIVHRDIKLENVLVNIRHDEIQSISDPLTHPTPIITLTDLGLGRRLPDPPDPPLLTTRCGSEDYAAPEILLGQPYDGRLTDAWALGVLLYALMEGRLPFDAPPGKPDRSRNSHRIARCDWIWCRFGDKDGEWDEGRGKEWEGARLCVEALLRKVRMGRKPLDEIAQMDWVRDGIRVPQGLQMRQEDEDDLT